MLFECPAYHRINRLKFENFLFSKFGGVSRVARSMKFLGRLVLLWIRSHERLLPLFQSAWTIGALRHSYVTSETLQELGLVEYKVDTFSSDYDDYVDEFGLEIDAHGA